MAETCTISTESSSQKSKEICKHCHKYYADLYNHIRFTHSGKEKTQSCDVCGYKAFKPYQIEKHKAQVHRNESKYSCDICENKFKSSQSFKRHMSDIHGVGEKVIMHCSKCDFVGSTSEIAKHRREIHRKTEVHQCETCEKSYNDPLSLKRNILVQSTKARNLSVTNAMLNILIKLRFACM